MSNTFEYITHTADIYQCSLQTVLYAERIHCAHLFKIIHTHSVSLIAVEMWNQNGR